MTALPDEALDAIERAAKEATPGPWHRNIRPVSRYPTVFAGRNTHVLQIVVRKAGSEEQAEANCEFAIAANPAAVLAMAAEIRDLRARAAEAERQRDEARAALEKAQTQSLIVDLANDLRRRGNATTSEEIGVGLHEAATLVEALATHPAFRP